MIQYSGEKSYIPLAQLKITVINVATHVKPRFRVIPVLRSRISKTAYCLSLQRDSLTLYF